MENRSGPRTEPCGMPYSRGRESEVKSHNLTDDDLFRMYELSHLSGKPLIPII